MDKIITADLIADAVRRKRGEKKQETRVPEWVLRELNLAKAK